jgi:DNA-binding NarL/FixJ family response regulator
VVGGEVREEIGGERHRKEVMSAEAGPIRIPAADHHPVVRLQMPEINGLDAIIAIRGEFPESRIVVLTTYAGDVQVLRALDDIKPCQALMLAEFPVK